MSEDAGKGRCEARGGWGVVVTLWRLDGGVRLGGRRRVPLCEELEVMDERLHVLLHLHTVGWCDLLVVHPHRARLEQVEALHDDADRLAHLLNPHQVTIVAVALGADGHLEVELRVDLVPG